MVDLLLVSDHGLDVLNLFANIQIKHVDRADLVTKVNQFVICGLNILFGGNDLVKNINLFFLDVGVLEL